MSKNKLEQIFREESIWETNLNVQLKTAIKNTFSFQNWFYTKSRTLQQTLNHCFTEYYGPAKAFRILYSTCALLKNNMQCMLFPKYIPISSEEAPSLENTLMEHLEFPSVSAYDFNIVFYHIPKGKSFLKPVLDGLTSPTRLKQIETHCIENTAHFLRIYRNFNGTGENTITVFSNIYTEELFFTLWTFLPHLMGITLHESNSELTEEEILYNKRVTSLYKLFENIYNIFQDNFGTTYTASELVNIKQNFKKLLDDYASNYDFISGMLESFTTRLAKAKNKAASEYYEKELNITITRISDYEAHLAGAYLKKVQLERQLNAVTLTSDEDIKPFIDYILKTKAIEVLTSTANELILRITAPLQFFQESDFETYEKNPNSTYNTMFIKADTLRKVFHKVFVTREYKILAQAIIHLQIQNGYADRPLNVYAERTSCKSSLTQFPNPHLYHHDCWSSAKTEMYKNICEGNYELVVMQMVAAVQTVNIAENTSFVNGLLNDIKNADDLRSLLTFVVNTPEGTKNFTYNEILKYEQNLEHQTLLQHAEEIIAQNPQTYTQVELPDDDQVWI